MTDSNKAAAKRWFEIGMSGNLSVAEQIFPAHFVLDGKPSELADVVQGYEAMLAGFPDARVEVDQQIAEGDWVATHYRVRATNLGSMQGQPPTNKPIEVRGLALWRFEDGKAVEVWDRFDTMGMLQQLGLMPPRPM